MNKKLLKKLLLEEKKQVLDDIQNGKSCRILSQKYRISKSTTCNIGKKGKENLEAWEKTVMQTENGKREELKV